MRKNWQNITGLLQITLSVDKYDFRNCRLTLSEHWNLTRGRAMRIMRQGNIFLTTGISSRYQLIIANMNASPGSLEPSMVERIAEMEATLNDD